MKGRIKNKITILLIFVSFIANAQYNNDDNSLKRNHVYLNGSASTWGFIFKASGNIKLKSDTFEFKGRSTPAIQVGYSFWFSEKFSLGLMLSTQKLGIETKYLVFKNADFITKRFNDFDVVIKRRYVGLIANYHFLKDKNHDIYGGLRFGGVFWKISPTITDTDLDDKLNASFPGSLLPAASLGYKYRIKEKVGLGFELSFGPPQIFSYGIDYRF
ncbi:MAG: hypothetical protein IT243_07235 [Bacteroidia bacterium]|nr:hypothetical protein [Bacteroidia bacterium]